MFYMQYFFRNIITCLFLFISVYSFAGDFITFSWKMKSRFNECTEMYNKSLHEYDKRIMDFSQGWVVEFKSSGKFGNIPNIIYTWEINGIGELSWYYKTYSSGSPNLVTSLPINSEV